MSISRKVISVTRTTYYLNVGFIIEIGNLLSNQYLHRRGRTFNADCMARILSVMAARRLEQTDRTSLAAEIDSIVSSVVGVWPTFVNDMFAHLPTNSIGKLNNENMKVQLLPKDWNQINLWVTNGTFQSDLLELKAFAEANSINLDNISLAQYIQPSIVMQVEKATLDPIEGITIPTKLRETKIETKVTPGEIVDGIKKPDVITETQVPVQSGPDTLDSIETQGAVEIHDKISFVGTSPDINIRTLSQASSIMFPIMEIVDKVQTTTTIVCHVNGRAYFAPESRSEMIQWLIAGFNILTTKHVKAKQPEPTGTLGPARSDTNIMPSVGPNPPVPGANIEAQRIENPYGQLQPLDGIAERQAQARQQQQQQQQQPSQTQLRPSRGQLNRLFSGQLPRDPRNPRDRGGRRGQRTPGYAINENYIYSLLTRAIMDVFN